MSNILILGGDSAIGTALQAFLRMKHNVTVTTRRDHSKKVDQTLFLDALDPASASIEFDQFDIIINVIACSKFDYCRENPTESRKINVAFPRYVARSISGSTRFIQFSTSAVLSCEVPLQSAFDRSFPRSEYGRQKREAEDRVLAEQGEVFRISKVLEPTDLLGDMLIKLKHGQPVRVFYDLYLCPLSLQSVLQAIKLIIDEGGAQVYQLSGDQDLSYEEVLRLIANNHGCDQSLIIPLSCEGYVYADHVLRYSSLRSSKIFSDSPNLDLRYKNIIRQIYG